MHVALDLSGAAKRIDQAAANGRPPAEVPYGSLSRRMFELGVIAVLPLEHMRPV